MIIDNVTQEQELPQNISIEPQRVNETQNVIEEQNLTQNVSVINPCENITCMPNRQTCLDGYVAECKNFCEPDTGKCSNCTPSCTGHDTECSKTCGACQQLDKIKCTCQDIKPCCGNGICENEESSDSCLEDCEPEIKTQTIELHVYISEIMYNPSTAQGKDDYNEWIEIHNPTNNPINLEGWMLCDDILKSGYVRYPDKTLLDDNGYVLEPGKRAIITDGGSGTEVYTNFAVEPSLALNTGNKSLLCGGLTNSNRTITLKDDKGNIIDEVTYYRTWGADGNGKSLQKINNEWVEAEPTPGR